MCTRPPPNLGLRPLAEAAYRENFHKEDHRSYFTEEPDIGPCMLSIKQEEETLSTVRLVPMIVCFKNCILR